MKTKRFLVYNAKNDYLFVSDNKNLKLCHFLIDLANAYNKQVIYYYIGEL